MSYTDMCRLCLGACPDSIDIFSKDAQKRSLALKVWKHLSIWVNEEDSLPKNICQQCIEEIEHFSSFAAKVEQVQQMICNGTSPTLKESSKKPELGCNMPDLTNKLCDIKIEYNPIFDEKEEASRCYGTADNNNTTKQEEAKFNDAVELFTSGSGLIAEESEEPAFQPADVHSQHLSDSVDQCKTESDDGHVLEMEKLCESSNGQNSITSDEDDMKLPEEQNKLDINLDSSLVNEDLNAEIDLAAFYKLSCEVCKDEEPFDKYEDLVRHCVLKHNTKAVVVCCGRKMIGKSLLRKHMHKHIKRYKCLQCGKELATKWTLNCHVLGTHVPEEKRPFKCRQCPRGFATKKGLNTHEQHHQWNEEKPSFICDTCGKRYPNPRCLSAHQLYQHKKEQRVMCHICPKMFCTLGAFRQHLTRHEPVSEPVKCKKCGKVLKNKMTLHTHMKLHGDKLFPCSQCDKVFKLPGHLKDHLRSHSNVRPHQCMICNKSFKLKFVLKEHMAQHTGERPHQCPYCPRTFASKANYYTHKRKMHSNSKSTDITNPKEIE